LAKPWRLVRGAVALLVAVFLAGCGVATPEVPPADTAWRGDPVAPVITEAPTTIGFADSDFIVMPAADMSATIARMRAIGVHSVRILVPWVALQKDRGAPYDWTLVDHMVTALAAQNMSILATLNSTPQWAVAKGQPALSGPPASPADYAAFAGAVAQRYRGRISAYEIWNEPNAAMFFAPGPDPARFVGLLKAAYPAIKAADPAALVVTGGLGAIVDHATVTMDAVKYLRGMYAAGAKNFFDGFGFHPYQYTTKFSVGGWHPDAPINQVAGIREVMRANGDDAKKIWLTEYGEPSSVVGERKQAEYIDDLLTAWRKVPYGGPVYLYTMRDRNSRSLAVDDTLGAFRSDGTEKPVVEVIEAHTRAAAVSAPLTKTAGR
jgi:polysaccharide biosynthesis protein PslG